MSRDIYRKYCDGDRITNAELTQAVIDYEAAEQALFKLGPAYEITRKSVTQTLISLEGMKRAREQK